MAKDESTIMVIEEFLETVEIAIEKVLQNNEQLATVNQELNSKIVDVLTKISSIVNQKPPQVNVTVDTNAITRINENVIAALEQLQSQNKVLIETITKLSTEGRSDNLMIEILAMIDKSNKFMANGLQQIDYSKELKRIGDFIEKSPKAWEFLTEKLNSTQTKTIATAK